MTNGRIARPWMWALDRALRIAVPMTLLLVACDQSPGAVRETMVDGSPSGGAPTPTPASPAPDPLVVLRRGYHVVNVVSGKAVPLAKSVTSIEGMSNLEVSPDGSMILFDNGRLKPRSAGTGLHQVYIANSDGSDVRRATDDPLGASSGSWSPDGNSIVFLGVSAGTEGRYGKNISVLDLATGTSRVVAAAEDGPFEEPHFVSDGSSIVFSRWRRRQDVSLGHHFGWDLWTVPLAGGEPRIALKGRGYADPSPDGRSILYPRLTGWIENNGGGTLAEIWISDADRLDPRVLVPATSDHLGAWTDAGWSSDGTRVAFDQYLPNPYRYVGGDRGVFVLNLLSGKRQLVAFGRAVDWLGRQTLIVRSAGTA